MIYSLLAPLLIKTKPKYSNIGFRIAISAIGAHIIVLNGHIISTFEALSYLSYYVAFIPSFAFAFLLCTYVHLVTKQLDKKHEWESNSAVRVCLQALLCLVVPLILNLGFAALYFKVIHDLPLRKTSFVSSELKIVMIMLLLLNVYYFAAYLFEKLKVAKQELLDKNNTIAKLAIFHEVQNEDQVREKKLIEQPEPEASIVTEPANEKEQEKETFTEPLSEEPKEVVPEIPVKPLILVQREIYIVNTPNRSIPLRVDQIAYFFRLNNANFLKTMDGEDFPISESLKEIEEQYCGILFFRINRQMIINFTTCKAFESSEKQGCLYLNLVPTIGQKFDEKIIALATVSEERVNNFKIWMDR